MEVRAFTPLSAAPAAISMATFSLAPNSMRKEPFAWRPNSSVGTSEEGVPG